MRSPDPSTWPPIWQRLWASLLATPGDAVLSTIARLWPQRRIPEARGALRLWIAVHRAQEVAHA